MLCAQRVHESARLKETAQSAELDRLRAVVRQRSDELAASRTDAARWEAAHARAEGALLHNGPDSAADAGNNDGLVNELLAQIEYWRAEAQARPDLETVKPAAPTAPTGERDHANNAAEICATPLRVHELETVSDGSSSLLDPPAEIGILAHRTSERSFVIQDRRPSGVALGAN